MTEKSMEIGKLLVPDQVTASHLKQALIQSADSFSTRRNRKHFWKWSSPQKVVHLLVWEINPIGNMKGGLKWLRKDTNPKKS